MCFLHTEDPTTPNQQGPDKVRPIVLLPLQNAAEKNDQIKSLPPIVFSNPIVQR
jgi:hypothetical protein